MELSKEREDDNRVMIIGGGPAGLTAAYQLGKKGRESVVFEKDSVVGGISRTVNYKNYLFDIGGHRFFTKIKAVENMWREVLAKDFLRCNRLSRIYYNKKFFYYPLRPLNALAGLGLWNSFMILLSYLKAHTFPFKNEDTFEQWVINRFGRRLYNTFFKAYTEKVWGISCKEIRAEWAAQRIKGLSLISAVKNALVQQNRNNKSNVVIKTLIGAFDYPKFGPGMMWQTVSELVQSQGSEVKMRSDVERILWNRESNKIDAVEANVGGHKELYYGSDFISSMPIRELIQKFSPAVPDDVLEAANNLNYRDFLTVALVVKKADLFPDNWIYIHDPNVKVGRVQNFKNWSPFMVPDKDNSCLGLEYFCFEGDELWNMEDEDLIELGKKETDELGLIKSEDVIDGSVVRMPKAYPSYDSRYKEMLEIIKNFLDGITNLQLIGRNGMHRYNNQDHSMLTAMLAAENICGAEHDLWSVNAEQEYHEEKAEEISEKPEELIPDEVIIRAFSKMDKLAFAMSSGITSGLIIFIATLWLVIKGGDVVGPNLRLLSQYFVGYTVTLHGSFIGMSYSFFWGFLFGWLFAYIRNISMTFYVYLIKKRTEMTSFRDFVDHF